MHDENVQAKCFNLSFSTQLELCNLICFPNECSGGWLSDYLDKNDKVVQNEK